MRLRNIPGSREAIQESPWCVREAEQEKGRWYSVFGNGHPIWIEVGMGKGQFLLTMATENPDVNFVGIEKYSSVLLRALQKMEEQPLGNVRFVRMEAENLTEVFAEGEVSRIYLNFSDPWPKDRHAKRRLTSREFFARYDKILALGGQVEFKTDNVGLFDFSLEQAKAAGWRVVAQTRDLHRDDAMCAGNVMTEYEERFSAKGNPICKLVVVRGNGS